MTMELSISPQNVLNCIELWSNPETSQLVTSSRNDFYQIENYKIYVFGPSDQTFHSKENNSWHRHVHHIGTLSVSLSVYKLKSGLLQM